MSLRDMSLPQLKTLAVTHGIDNPDGDSRRRATWIASIIKSKKFEEYSAYGKHSRTVKKMVNNNNTQICTLFFCNNSTIVKPFNNNVYDIIDYYKSNPMESVIVPTFIQLWDVNTNSQSGNHAVLYVQDNNKKFLFDPNGVVDDSCGLIYMNPNKYGKYGKEGFTSAEFTAEYKVDTPLEIGVQSTAPFTSLYNTNYISGGGYCMFYVRLALEHLEKHKTLGGDIVSEAKKLSSPVVYNSPSSPFGIPNDLEQMSVSLVHQQLGAGRGKKRSYVKIRSKKIRSKKR
jgi:hypothetical protein